jgi:hypothetical protein
MRNDRIDFLDDSDTGVWQVTTEVSILVIDLDQGRLIRYPGTAADTHLTDDDGLVVNHLPDDNEWVPLVLLAQCRVGAPLMAFTGSEESGHYWRVSTRVHSITRVAARHRSDGEPEATRPGQPATAEPGSPSPTTPTAARNTAPDGETGPTPCSS